MDGQAEYQRRRSDRACERRTRRHDVQYAAVSGDCDVRALEQWPFWRSSPCSSLPRQVSTPVPATVSTSTPAPTGGECDTVGVSASKDENLVDKDEDESSNNVATEAAVEVDESHKVTKR